MPNYRRADISGATYFFTVVSHRRRPILCDESVRHALRQAINIVKTKHSFDIDAWVLLPDHLHCIWTLPENDHAYSVRWSMIKRLVTQAIGMHYKNDTDHGAHGATYEAVQPGGRVRRAHHMYSNSEHSYHSNKPLMSASRLRRCEGDIWQRRFWEHRVRDQADLNRCLDYLHWNPVKHGYVNRVAEWQFSTFHRYVREGAYPEDWGGKGVADEGAFGE